MVTEYRIKRVEKGLRQVDLSAITGIKQEKISLVERGFPPTPEEAKKLSRALGIDDEKEVPGNE